MALGFWTDVLRSLHLRGLTETVDAVRQRWGGSRLLLGLDIVWCALRYGAGFQDYRLFAFESLTGRQRRTYLTRGSNRRLVDRQNPKSLRFLLEDKGTFDRLFLSQLADPFWTCGWQGRRSSGLSGGLIRSWWPSGPGGSADRMCFSYPGRSRMTCIGSCWSGARFWWSPGFISTLRWTACTPARSTRPGL